MSTESGDLHDVMLVCRNGHVITEQLRTDPAGGTSHCGGCGADTLFQCATCGRALPGTPSMLGMVPIGSRQPPQFCADCGAAFPWTKKPALSVASGCLDELETLLRRLPRVIRQLRSRHADRPPFRVVDRRDLEDLLRALLPLHYDDVRLESRTPSYAASPQTDFLLQPESIALTAKHVPTVMSEHALVEQRTEDINYYQRRGLATLVTCIHDPLGQLRDSSRLEAGWSEQVGDLCLRCVIAK